MLSAEKPSDSQPDLHCIYSWIQVRQARVGDVHISQFQAPVVLLAEDVRAKSCLIHEVNRVGIRGHCVIGQNDAARELEKRREVAAADEIPLEAKRIESYAVGSVGGLEDEKHWDGIDGVFEASAQKAGKMRVGENPSVAEAGVESAGIAASSSDRMAATTPDLDFVSALLRSGLSEARGRGDEKNYSDAQGCAQGRPQNISHDRGSHGDWQNFENEGTRYRKVAARTNRC
jgi:hypothetical protein